MGKSAINPAVVGKHSTDIAALKNDLGIVEDGDTATHTIAQGQYVIWQGALYTADAAIASGTTLSASGGNKNLTSVENGGLNALNGNFNPSGWSIAGLTFSDKCSYSRGGYFQIGKLFILNIQLVTTEQVPQWHRLVTGLPRGVDNNTGNSFPVAAHEGECGLDVSATVIAARAVIPANTELRLFSVYILA